MRIAFIGKFARLYDEEYIARSFEALGHEVMRLPNEVALRALFERIDEWKPDICLFTKFEPSEGGNVFLNGLRDRGIKSICWLFDLYWGYPREHMVHAASYFRADYVVTTDDGHAAEWAKYRINHVCVRQGIYKPEAVVMDAIPEGDIVFVGADNALNAERTKITKALEKRYEGRFVWYGKRNTHEIRGMDLNILYAKFKVVVGDSVWSPYYWSNRVVETLGRGGNLIHVDVPGIHEEYPDLTLYERGNLEALFSRIDYFLAGHDKERKEIIKKNHALVSQRYTMEDKCAELLVKTAA